LLLLIIHLNKGSGAIYSLAVTDRGQIQQINQLHWDDGIFDVAWSEDNPNLVVGASGDGSLQMWNLEEVKFPICGYYCFQYKLFLECSSNGLQRTR